MPYEVIAQAQSLCTGLKQNQYDRKRTFRNREKQFAGQIKRAIRQIEPN